MTDPTSPSDGSLKGTLTAHYRGEIDRLRQRSDLDADTLSELQDLDRGFAGGFDDALCDRFETIVQRVVAQSSLSYLSATPTGDAVTQSAAARLARDERIVSHLTASLSDVSIGQRPAAAAALRDALASHRTSWHVAAARRAVPPDALAPAQALLRGIEAGVEALVARPAQVPTEAQSEPRNAGREIDVARLLARVGGPARAAADDIRGQFVLEDIADDGTVRELLRARIDQARSVSPPSTAASDSRLAAADQALALAAQSLGAAWTGDALSRQAIAADRPAQLAGLATLRADIYRQRVESAVATGAARAAMERRHAKLVAAAHDARNRAQGEAELTQSELARARADVASELGDAEGRVAPALLATLKARAHAVEAQLPSLPSSPGVAASEAALAYALSSSAPEQGDLQAEVAAGSAGQQRASMGVLAERLLRRQASASFASLPDFGASRVYASDRAALDPLPDSSMWGDVQDRRRSRDEHEPSAPVPPRIASLGRAIAGSIERLVGSPARRPTPVSHPDATAQVMPRMAARMPSNIFANTSSARMQSLYMPVLARMVGRPTPMLARPRARRKDNAGALLDSVATPEGLYSLLLGEVGDRLYEEKPEVAQRLEASLKRAAAALPNAGDQAMPVLQRHTEQFRTTVETWLGSGSEEGVERGRTEEVLSAGQGAARTVGDYVGGMFAIDQHGAGASEIDLLQHRTDEVESQLRAERTFVDQSLLDRVSGMVGRGPARAVEAYQGPMAQAIAQEMGAEAFTVENKMFFPHSVPESIKAHEMVHAIDASSDAHPRTIEDEERLAYGVQGQFEQGRKAIDLELRNATERMDLAKEQNIPPAQLTTDPGGASGTESPDPALRTSNPKDQMFKEEQLMEAVADAVESMILMEEDIDRERYGRT